MDVNKILHELKRQRNNIRALRIDGTRVRFHNRRSRCSQSHASDLRAASVGAQGEISGALHVISAGGMGKQRRYRLSKLPYGEGLLNESGSRSHTVFSFQIVLCVPRHVQNFHRRMLPLNALRYVAAPLWRHMMVNDDKVKLFHRPSHLQRLAGRFRHPDFVSGGLQRRAEYSDDYFFVVND